MMRNLAARCLAGALALLAGFSSLPAPAQATTIVRGHCTNNNLWFVSTFDTVTRMFTLRYVGLCYAGPYIVRLNVYNFSVHTETDITSGLNRYELAAFRALTGPVRDCPWVEPSPQFRAEIERYRVRGSISVSLSQLSPGIAQALAERLPATEQR